MPFASAQTNPIIASKLLLCLLPQHKPPVSLLVSFLCVFCLRTNRTAVCCSFLSFFLKKKKWNDDYHLCSNTSILFKSAISILLCSTKLVKKKKNKQVFYSKQHQLFKQSIYIYILMSSKAKVAHLTKVITAHKVWNT